MCMGDFRLMPLFQDSKFLVKNVGARAHLQHWLLRPCEFIKLWGRYNILNHMNIYIYRCIASNNMCFI